jgi:predicted metal-dependent TIM-barrel fold hydrolase
MRRKGVETRIRTAFRYSEMSKANTMVMNAIARTFQGTEKKKASALGAYIAGTL